jgi:cytochrome P450
MEITREFFAREELAALESDSVGRNRQTFFEFFSYYSRLMEDRRANPRHDLATTFANARIDGKPMGRLETLAYGLVTVTAGHETTRGSIAGGLLALIERPEVLRRWAKDPALTATAADEVLRFVSPVTYMMRTAVQDYLLRGQTIRAGDRLLLFYASANRDEDVFPHPDELDLGRHPNPHLALGTGEHGCLGGQLAKRMTGAVLEEFARRVESVELAGSPVRIAANMIPSIASLPIRYRLRPSGE